MRGRCLREAIIVLMVAGCHDQGLQPSPLGILDAHDLPSWQAECSTPLVETRVCGRLAPEKCDRYFHTVQPNQGALIEDTPGSSATLKRACASEGWAVWTDTRDRIIAFCMAQPPEMNEWPRIHQFIERHRSKAVADKIIEKSMGHCTDCKGWGTWAQMGMIEKPPEMRGVEGCVEFRLDP